VEKLKPGYLDDTRKWFKVYKVADGKPESNFAFDGAFRNREFAEGLVAETHEFWRELIEDRASSDLAK